MRDWLQRLFRRTTWEVVYSTQNVQASMSIKGRLLAAGIEAKTERIGAGGGEGSGDAFGTLYHILVKEENVHAAHRVIHHEHT